MKPTAAPSPSAVLVLSAMLLSLATGPSAAQTDLAGQTANGSYYRIIAPDGWSPADGLVIYNHGFDIDPPAPNPGLGPLADLHLDQGYAIAASSYSLNGWAMFDTVEDLEQLVDVFTNELGTPDQVLLYGASLGGAVTIQAVEAARLGNVVGALPFCGALAGSRAWDGAFHLRLAYDAVCEDVSGAQIPGGFQAHPYPFNQLDAIRAADALNRCTGALLPANQRTAAQRQRLQRLLDLADIPETFFVTDMGYAVFSLSDLINDPRKLDGGAAFGNRDVIFDDPVIEARIERTVADPAARERLLANYSPTGRVGQTKIVSIHTDKDGLVFVEHVNEYAELVPRRNFSVGIAIEDEPTHCGFTRGELVGAWEALRAWVAGGGRPTGEDLQASCQEVVDAGRENGPCRIDPTFVIGDLDDRVPGSAGVGNPEPEPEPGPACTEDARSLCLAADRFRVQVTWEDFEGNTGFGRAIDLGSPDTGSFWFFNQENFELMVKVLDAREINGRFWVFYGSLTNVAFELTVTDTETGAVKVYENPSGRFASVGDTAAF